MSLLFSEDTAVLTWIISDSIISVFVILHHADIDIIRRKMRRDHYTWTEKCSWRIIENEPGDTALIHFRITYQVRHIGVLIAKSKACTSLKIAYCLICLFTCFIFYFKCKSLALLTTQTMCAGVLAPEPVLSLNFLVSKQQYSDLSAFLVCTSWVDKERYLKIIQVRQWLNNAIHLSEWAWDWMTCFGRCM